MGRKIPAKKHRGIKDPLVQQAKRLQELKGKINAPPKDPDEQPVPRSLTQLFAFQNRSKFKNVDSKNKKKTKKKSMKEKDGISSYSENPIKKMQKLPGESGRAFSLRINSAIKALHNPTLKEDYPQDLDAEDIKGEQMAFQRERRKKKQKRKLKADGANVGAPEAERAQRRGAGAAAGAAGASEGGEREVHYERVRFGEVAHAPPALPVRPRARAGAAAAAGAGRPGQRQLLLSGMLAGGARAPLPAVELERRERARLAAVAAYRALRRRPGARAPR